MQEADTITIEWTKLCFNWQHFCHSPFVKKLPRILQHLCQWDGCSLQLSKVKKCSFHTVTSINFFSLTKALWTKLKTAWQPNMKSAETTIEILSGLHCPLQCSRMWTKLTFSIVSDNNSWHQAGILVVKRIAWHTNSQTPNEAHFTAKWQTEGHGDCWTNKVSNFWPFVATVGATSCAKLSLRYSRRFNSFLDAYW